MASIGPHIPAHLPVGGNAASAAEQQQPRKAGPSTIPVPRYEEEEDEEEEDEDEDAYAPALPPELVAARANPTGPPPPPSSSLSRRPIGPTRGPVRREEEEEESESEDDDEIGPAPLPPMGSSSLHAREDAVTEFMQKEAQRRQAVEVRWLVHLLVLRALLPRRACMHLCAY
jgi:ribosomal protein L12E/L44/L45/RPP1/RPP2